MLSNNIFRLSFRPSVNRQRMRRIFFHVVSFYPVENEIGGKEHKWNIRRHFHEIVRDADIGALRQVRVRLAERELSYCGAMNQEPRLLFAEQFADRCFVEQIDLLPGKPACLESRSMLNCGPNKFIAN